MNDQSNVVSIDTYQTGYDVGYREGLAVGLEQRILRGFWYGVATSAVIVMIVWLIILGGLQ